MDLKRPAVAWADLAEEDKADLLGRLLESEGFRQLGWALRDEIERVKVQLTDFSNNRDQDVYLKGYAAGLFGAERFVNEATADLKKKEE